MDQCPELGSPPSEALASHPTRASRLCQPHGSEEKGEKKKERKEGRKEGRKEERKKEKVIKIKNNF